MNPHPHGRLLLDIWGVDPKDLWAAGEGGTLLHWDGEGWDAKWSPTQETINQVWGLTSDDFWLTTGSSLFHVKSGRASEETLPSKGYLQSVWGSAPDDIWAIVGNSMMHRQRGQWSRVELPADAAKMKRIWGSDSDHVWLVGKQIFRWDGSTWTQELDTDVCKNSTPDEMPPLDEDHNSDDEPPPWSDIRGRGSEDVWVTNYGAECVVHWDGQTWSRMPDDAPKLRRLFDVHGSEDVGALNDNDEITRWDGVSWRPITSIDNAAREIAAVWADAHGEVWSVGGGVRVKQWKNGASTEFAPFSGVTWSNLNDVHGLAPPSKKMWIVGGEGLILQYDGRTFTQERPATVDNPTSVWAQSESNVWAVGENGTILNRGADGWSVSDNVEAQLTAVWADSRADAWAVGMQGAIYRFDGTNWRAFPSPTAANLLGVWGASSKDVWVVGGELDSTSLPSAEVAELYHWNGESWDKNSPIRTTGADAGLDDDGWKFCTLKDRSSPPFGAIGIWGVSTSDVWVTTRCAGPLHFDGESWQHVNGSENDRDARGIWAGSGSVWIVGNWGRVDRLSDGFHDASIQNTTTPRLNAVWGASTGEVWAIGNDGTILRNDSVASAPQ